MASEAKRSRLKHTKKTNVARHAKKLPVTVLTPSEKPRSQMSTYELLQAYRRDDPSLGKLFDHNWMFGGGEDANENEMKMEEKEGEISKTSIDAMVILYRLFLNDSGLSFDLTRDLYEHGGANEIKDAFLEDFGDDADDADPGDFISNMVDREPEVVVVCLKGNSIFRGNNMNEIVRNIENSKMIVDNHKNILIRKLMYAKELLSYGLIDDQSTVYNMGNKEMYEPGLWDDIMSFLYGNKK